MRTAHAITRLPIRPATASVRPALRPGMRSAGCVCLAGAALLVLFWCLYVTGPLAPPADAVLVRSFEAAFPIPDAILAAALVAAGIRLLRGDRRGVRPLTAAGAMSLYLGLLDASFYAGLGLNDPRTAEGLPTFTINLVCVVGGMWALWAARRMWGDR